MTSQESFSCLWQSKYATAEEAKAARDARYRELKAQGHVAKRWTLKNQREQYASFGNPSNRVGDVYMLNIY